jgi:hypothetical protein
MGAFSAALPPIKSPIHVDFAKLVTATSDRIYCSYRAAQKLCTDDRGLYATGATPQVVSPRRWRQ